MPVHFNPTDRSPPQEPPADIPDEGVPHPVGVVEIEQVESSSGRVVVLTPHSIDYAGFRGAITPTNTPDGGPAQSVDPAEVHFALLLHVMDNLIQDDLDVTGGDGSTRL